MNKAVFIDRDGVINKQAKAHEYITSWKEFKFFPTLLNAFAKISKTDYKIIIITNQRGIARGKMSVDDLGKIHKKMSEEIIKAGGRIDGIYFCPHDDNSCNCRKPLPGLLDKAMNEKNLCLQESWVVGNFLSDIELGKSRNCKTIYIGNNKQTTNLSDFSVNCLDEAVDLILSFT